MPRGITIAPACVLQALKCRDLGRGLGGGHSNRTPAVVSKRSTAVPDIHTLFNNYHIPLDTWIQAAVNWMILHLRPFFLAIRWPVARVLDGFETFLQGLPVWVFLLALIVVAWRIGSK